MDFVLVRTVEGKPEVLPNSPVFDSLEQAKKAARRAKAQVGEMTETHIVSTEGRLYTVGDLAYFDSLEGLVPVKVTGVFTRDVTFEVTAARGHWRPGASGSFPPNSVVPRDHIYRSQYGSKIVGTYRWIP